MQSDVYKSVFSIGYCTLIRVEAETVTLFILSLS